MKKERKPAYLAPVLAVVALVILFILVRPYYLGSTVDNLNQPSVIDNASFLANSQYSINLNDYFPGASNYAISEMRGITGVIENGVLILTSQPGFTGTETAKVTAYYENEQPVEGNEFSITVEAPEEKGGDFGIASLPGDISSCQVIDYTPGIYTLDRNLSASGNCFNVIVGDVTINCQGNSITGNGSGDGIYLTNVQNVVVENCRIYNFTNGIDVYNSSDNNVSENNLTTNTFGIQLTNSTYNYVYGNIITNNSNSGIFYAWSSFNIISSNTLDYNQDGIISDSWRNNFNNDIIFNAINNTNDRGIEFGFESNNSRIMHNTIENSGDKGMHLVSANLTLYNNTVRGSRSSSSSVYLTSSSWSTLTANRITNNYYSQSTLSISSSNSVNVSYNTIDSNAGHGILSTSSNGLMVKNNNISNNAGAGIELYSTSSNSVIFSNNIINNSQGIYLYNSYPHNISFNNFSENSEDIFIDASSDTECNNIIQNNTGSGGRSILYYNDSIAIENQTIAELILCDADNSNITNVTVKGGTGRNNGFFLTRVNNSVISNSTSINNFRGFYIVASANNTLNGTIIDNATGYSIYVDGYGRPIYNKFMNVSIVNAYPGAYDIYLSNANGTEIIDTELGKYNITVSRVTFEDTKYGKIKFLSSLTGNGLNLSDDIKIGNNSVYVNASKVGLNESANITLYNLKTTYARPAILRDGGLCPSSICTALTGLNAGTVVFNVTRWSNYSIDEGFDEIGICRKLNVSDTIYKLNSSAVTNFTCFNVTATNVTIDCGNWGNRIIYGNSSSSTTYYGVYSNSTKTTVKNCEITMGERANPSLERYAIYYYGSSNGTIYNVNASNNRQGIVMEGTSSQNNITNNIASFNEQTGIYLITNVGNKIMNNIANNNKFGIRIYWQSDDNLIQDNSANNNREAGFYFGPDANNNTIKLNTAVNNSYGIILQDGNYSIFDLNKIRNNNYGLFLNASNYNNLTSNELNNNSNYGVYLYSSNNSFIFNNTIISNNYGINICASQDNYIYNNYFNNTILNANATGTNYWNKTKISGINIINGSWIGGNYWSDYNGSDKNGDGIGDSKLPYNASNNISIGGDWLPLGGLPNNLPNITQAIVVNSTFGTNYTDENLTCWAKASDSDLDNLNYSGSWYKNGIINSSFSTINYTQGVLVSVAVLDSSKTSAGDKWSCEVRAFDGYNYSIYMISKNLTIRNMPPAMQQVILNSTFGTNYTDENLTCWAKASDSDLDNLNYSGSWYKDGVLDSTFASDNYVSGILANVSTLDSSLISLGENWSCEVRAYDGIDYSGYVISNNVTISPLACGAIITRDIVLSANLICNVTALTIGANNVTLDCDGYTIKGNLTGRGIYIPNTNSVNNTEIKNCIIENFSEGIWLGQNSGYINVTNNVLSLNGNGITLISYNTTIKSNTLFSNRVAAIFISGQAYQNTIIDNVIYNNFAGIDNGNAFLQIHIYNNKIYNNTGFNAYSSTLVNWNTTLNCGAGPNIIGGNCIGGNYWSDYIGSDINGDGIGDTKLPYNGTKIFNGGDWLPLGGNKVPNITRVIVSSTYGTNYTTEDLTAYVINATDTENNLIKNIINWRKNESSIAVLNMPFEGGSNSTWTRDYSGFGNNGRVVGATWNATGGYDSRGVYGFDGNDFINVTTDNLATNITNEFTIAFWMNPSSVIGDYPLIFKTNGNFFLSSNMTNGFVIRTSDPEKTIGITIANGTLQSPPLSNATLVAGNNLISVGNWTFVTITYNSTGYASIYVNGTYQAGKCFSCEGNYLNLTNTLPLKIGGFGRKASGLYGYFMGYLDDVTVYNKALSAEQIAALYNNRTDLIVSQELAVGDVWRADVTPNDGFADGITKSSNNVTIVAGAICGNLVCETGEDCSSCPGDCGACPSGGGGGGGGYDTFTPSESQLNSGYSNSYSKSDRMRFTFNKEIHYIILQSISTSTNSVTVIIKSLPMTVVLWLGEPKKVDINDDGIYDLLLRLNKISYSRADIFVQRIYESVYVAPAPTPAPEVPPAEIPPAPEVPPIAEEKGISTGTIVIISLAVLIVVICAIILVVRARKEREMIEKGKNWVEDARRKGYGSKEINRILHEREWKRQEIKKVMEKEKKKK